MQIHPRRGTTAVGSTMPETTTSIQYKLASYFECGYALLVRGELAMNFFNMEKIIGNLSPRPNVIRLPLNNIRNQYSTGSI